MSDSQEFVIDIPVTVQDQTDPGASNAQETIDSLKKSIDSLKGGIKGLKDSSSQVDKIKMSTDKLKTGAVSLGAKGHEVFTSLGNSIKNGFLKGLNMLMAPLNFIKKSIFSIGGLIGIGTSWWAFVMSPLKMADNLAKAKAGLVTWAGSVDQANKMMEAFDKLSYKSVISTEEWADSATRALKNKWVPDKVPKNMEILGNISAASQKGSAGVDWMVKMLNNIKNNGVQPNIERLSNNFGIPLADILRTGLGMNREQFQKALKNKTISKAQAINAIMSQGETNPKFKGALEKESETTYEGMAKRTKAYVSDKFIKPWGEGIRIGLIDTLKELDKALLGNDGKFTKWGDKLQSFSLGAVKSLTGNLKGLIDKFNKISDSDAFKKADLGGKIHILWDDLIEKPFVSWWNTRGKNKFIEVGSKMNKLINDMLGGKEGENAFVTLGEKIGQGLVTGIKGALNLFNIGSALGFKYNKEGKFDLGASLKGWGKSYVETGKEGYELTKAGKKSPFQTSFPETLYSLQQLGKNKNSQFGYEGSIWNDGMGAKTEEQKALRDENTVRGFFGLEPIKPKVDVKGISEQISSSTVWDYAGAQAGRYFKNGFVGATSGITHYISRPVYEDKTLPKPMASGGIVTRPTVSLIGESGPEAVIPLNKKMGSNSISVNLSPVINITSSAKAEDVLRVIEESKNKIFDDAAEHIANKLSEIYTNMPVGI
jgi:hypothetical protein